MENILDLDIDKLNEESWELKFFVWGRKIEEEVLFLEDQGNDFSDIRNYLQKCSDMREKFLDKDDLTEIDEIYTDKIHYIFEKYGVIDPIY